MGPGHSPLLPPYRADPEANTILLVGHAPNYKQYPTAQTLRILIETLQNYSRRLTFRAGRDFQHMDSQYLAIDPLKYFP